MRFSGKLFILLLWNISLFSFVAQAEGVEEAQSEEQLERLENDTLKVEKLIALYDRHYKGTEDSANIGTKFIIQAYYLSGRLHWRRGIRESAFRIAENLLRAKNLLKATEFYFITLREAEAAGDKLLAARVHRGLGLVFFNQDKWKDALIYFDHSISGFRFLGDEEKANTAIYLKGLCYNHLSRFKEAEYDLKDAIAYARLSGDSNRIYECTIGLAESELGRGNYYKAMEMYNLADAYYTEKRERIALSLVHAGKAEIWLRRNNNREALAEANHAYTIAHSTVTAINLANITSLLHRIYYKIGDKNKAYQYLLEHLHIKDSIYNFEVSSRIAQAGYNYALETNEMKFNVEMDKNIRRRNLAVFSAVVLMLFMLLIFLAYRSVRKERKKSEDLLLNILPLHTAEELKKFGRAIPKSHIDVSVMFCDVAGFTTISSNMTAEDLVTMLDFYFRNFDEIIKRHSLEKIKTIGDSYMCATGLQSDKSNNAGQCIDAALEMLYFIQSVAPEMKERYGQSFSFRIGIHTGNLVSGVVGSTKYAYDIWGDTVNVASRMEDASEPGEINISGDTFREAGENYNTVYRGKIVAKHKGELDMYFVKGRKS